MGFLAFLASDLERLVTVKQKADPRLLNDQDTRATRHDCEGARRPACSASEESQRERREKRERDERLQ
jgi:hypothetical protein